MSDNHTTKYHSDLIVKVIDMCGFCLFEIALFPASILSHHSKLLPMNADVMGNLQAVGGLLLTGAGLSMAIDAGTVRAKKGKWFLYGTVALVVFQTGLCLVVGAGSRQ